MKININDQVAGPKLDSLVAEHYMGWTNFRDGKRLIWRPPDTKWEGQMGMLRPPLYSVDTSLAMQIIFKMTIDGVKVMLKNHLEWRIIWCICLLTKIEGDKHEWTHITGPTVEVTICRSALWLSSNPIPPTVLQPVPSFLSKEKQEALAAQNAKANGRGFAGKLTVMED